ncbi:MAG TPA: PspC domain-containing protein [Egibacteraceae bacterium]|nr:PspC domain-containing protein [Egibacteraceae bacterium]
MDDTTSTPGDHFGTPGSALPHDETPEGSSARRLTRRSEGRMVAGVASGIADHLSIDPVLVRLGFAALVFFGGAGFILYAVGWALMPERSGGQPMAQKALDSMADGPSWLGVAFLLTAAWILAVQIDLWSPAVTWALVFIALGVYLLRRDQRRPADPHPPGGDLPPPPGAGPEDGPWQPQLGAHTPQEASPPPPMGPGAAAPSFEQPPQPPAPPGGQPMYGAAPWQAPSPREPRSRSVLGRLTIAMTLVALGLAAMLDNAGQVFMTPTRYVALALTGAGIGLVVGAWRGRSRGLIALGLLLALLLVPTALIERTSLSMRGGVGERYWSVSSTDDLQEEYYLGLGEAVLDLTDLASQRGEETVTVRVGAGELLVLAPQGWDIHTSATLDAGEVSLLGREANGTGLHREMTVPGDGTGGTLTLDIQMGVGSVTVMQPDEVGSGGDEILFDEEGS